MFKYGAWLSVVLGWSCCAGAVGATDSILFADFESERYGGWTAAGTAFGDGPATGTLPDQMPVSGFRGRRLVNSYRDGDGSQGTLTSQEFVIRRRYVNFLIGGGAHPGQTCMNLVVGGKAVRSATGFNNERLTPIYWDVRDLLGRTARIEIVDRAGGRWGHINVDDIRFSDRPSGEKIVTDDLYNETYRPQFHFSAKKNWLNDPNGLVHYNGTYHLFFQYNPFGREWGNMTWGHAVSPDLVHWEQRPDALEPDRLGTIFSGSAVVDHENTAGFQKGQEKTIALIYTAAGGTSKESEGQRFTQALAYSADGGKTFHKYEKNPVLGHIVGENRDPKVIWHAPTRRWVMVLYLDGSDYGVFASPDLKTWERLQTLSIPGTIECPDLFELPVTGEPNETRWVVTAANGHYLIGRFDGKRFTQESGPHPSDLGANFFAVQTYSDVPDGRRIQVAWMRGGNYPGMPFNQQMSFPCVLTLHRTSEGLRLYRAPVREIEKLRLKPRRWENVTLRPGENPLSEVKGDLFDIEAELDPGDADEIIFTLRGEEVRYDAAEKRLSFLERSGELAPDAGRIRLRFLVDHTSIEAFGNGGRLSMTSAFLPPPDQKGLAVSSRGGTARIRSLTVYPLKSAWPARPKR